MDRDTVRMILLLLGVLIIAWIYVWGRYGSTLRDFFQRRGAFDELALDEPCENTGEDDPDGSSVSAVAARDDGYAFQEQERSFRSEPSRAVPVSVTETQRPRDSSVGAPFLIQVSVVARRGDFFSGAELRDALLDLGLVHGEMDIFHRYDRNFREPLFSVASLVHPGTFPIDEMEDFRCPGVVLFFQPSKVSDPLAVFDDLFETSRDLAEKLDGEEWDESRRPLTEEKIRELRDQLEDICG